MADRKLQEIKIDDRKIPRRYIPVGLSKRDTMKQRASIKRSRKAYTKRKYVDRPRVKSFVSKPSSHVSRAKAKFGVDSMVPSPTLVKATGCKMWALNKIINKGEGAYYSSGSRPNQTPQSWGYARLASALTGGPAAKIDADILERGCSQNRYVKSEKI